MLISELFYSLQGEGALTGVPSVFIRTSGCNLRCRWCDTPYASWQPEGTEMTPEEIMSKVQAWTAARHVVITGGEPMIARGIHSLSASLRGAGYHITIETAGTIAPGGIPCDLASISPKLRHSTPGEGEGDRAWQIRHETTRLQPAILRQWLTEVPEFQLKFVVSTADDLAEIEGVLETLGTRIPPWRVQLMPEARSVEELQSRSAWLSDACLSRGWRYCQRLHILLYGNKRGT